MGEIVGTHVILCVSTDFVIETTAVVRTVVEDQTMEDAGKTSGKRSLSVQN